jgi:hypothetical protein
MTLEEVANWFSARGVDYSPPEQRGDLWVAGYQAEHLGKWWMFAGETAEKAADSAYTNARALHRSS